MKLSGSGRRGATILVAGIAAVVLLTLVFLGPTSFRIWSSQRSQTKELNDRITALDRANAQLEARAAQLRNPEAVRELARRDYGMVPKGSKAFAIIPAPVPDDRPGGLWPFVELQPGDSTSAPAPTAG